MSEQSEPKPELPKEQNSTENKQEEAQSKNEPKGSRYTKTFEVFQQMGLLDYALQMAKLCKENELLQQKINDLEAKVNESGQKSRQGLKEPAAELQGSETDTNTADDVSSDAST